MSEASLRTRVVSELKGKDRRISHSGNQDRTVGSACGQNIVQGAAERKENDKSCY